MDRQIDATRLQAILDAVAAKPDGISAPKILEALGSPMPMRTLQHRLRRLVADEKLVREGSASASTYCIPNRFARAGKKESTANSEIVPLSEAGAAIRNYVSQPMAARKPVAYNADFLDSYRPNETRCLRDEDFTRLHDARISEFAQLPAGTYAKRMLDRPLIELSWNSSRLEGSTFSILDTQRLIHFGFADAGKDRQEIQMILNHKAAMDFLVDSAEEIGFNRYTILNLHEVNFARHAIRPSEFRNWSKRWHSELSGSMEIQTSADAALPQGQRTKEQQN